ncbi:MAG: LPP20 family lipoprotein [Nitrospinota bacterium]
MKRQFLCNVVIAGTFIVTGCGGPKKPTQVESPQMIEELSNAPEWVLDPSVEGGIASVGSAKIGKAGIQFARTEALANGRDEIARQITVKVKNLVKSFTQVTGIGDDQVVDKVSSQVSKQVSSEVITGSKQKNLWISPSNELFIFVVVDPGIIKEAVKNSVQSSYKNEKALWQQFQAKKAHEELDKEIDKEFSGK